MLCASFFSPTADFCCRFFERPSWCFESNDTECAREEVSFGAPILPIGVSLALEAICCAYFLLRYCIKIGANGLDNVLANKIGPLVSYRCGVAGASLIDIFFAAGFHHAYRLSTLLRPFVFVFMSINIRKAF